MNYVIEIATGDFSSTQAAVKGGADRIELCTALAEGGITPSQGLIRKCRDSFDVDLFPIIRPRGGDFLYSDEEFDIMMKDIKKCKQLDCAGVVFGLLSRDGNLDLDRTEKLIKHAFPMEVCFHRAFDRCKDPFMAMEQLIEIGCRRILTSGQAANALKGASLIKQLIQAAQDRITIMPGGGIRKENIKTLAEKTGATEFHSSLKSMAPSKMKFIHPAFAKNEESYNYPGVESQEVRSFRKALKA